MRKHFKAIYSNLRPSYGLIGRTTLAICLSVGMISTLQQSSHSVDIVETTEVIDIEVHKGTILRLDRNAETVFVSDPSIVDVQVRSKKTIFVYGLATGETTLFALDKNDEPVLSSMLKVSHNISAINGIIRRLNPDSDVTVTSVPRGLVLQGIVQSPSDADEISLLAQQFVGDNENVINRLSVASPTQVNLRVKIVEASRETVRALGITWSVDTVGKFAFSGITSAPGFAADANITHGDFSWQNAAGDSIGALIDALDTDGVVTILAEPNLTAISGETASFLAGGEFPVPVGIDDRKIEIQFKQFGVSLAFTPTVLSGGRINLKIRVEVSQLSDAAGIELNGAVIPGLTTRRADTTVSLASGQSFALAGLISNRKSNDISKVPGLGSIPILGKLFQSRKFQESETELIIIATPYLVRPVDPSSPLRTPDQEEPTIQQFEELLSGGLQTSDAAMGNSTTEGQQLSSPVGFIME